MSMADDDNTNKAAVGTLDAFLKKRANDRFGRFLTEAPNTLLGGGWRDADLEPRKQGGDQPRLTFPLPSDDDDTIKIYPLSELMKRKPRAVLVEHFLFMKGITTLVAKSGWGKTTTAVSIALLVAAGGRWGGKQIVPRLVLWIAGEGEEDIPGMIQAGAKQHGLKWEDLPISIDFEAVEFSSHSETDKLIEKLEGMPPMLIVADALGDMMGMLDEDKAQHINLVYRNLRRVEKATGCVFLILHHQGWSSDRERGSAAIRDKSDILVQITELNLDAGYIKFTHHKRRGGARVKEFAYEVKMHTVEMCLQPVPIVTGVPKSKVDIVLGQDWTAAEEGARKLVQIVMQWPEDGGKPTYTRLLKRSGMEESEFERARKEAVYKEWLVGGGKKGYRLNENECWKEALASAPPSKSPSESPSPSPLKEGCEGEGRRISPSAAGKLKAIEGEGKSSAVLPSDEAEEALAVTLDTAAILKKVEKR
jgi:hypothetical protein